MKTNKKRETQEVSKSKEDIKNEEIVNNVMQNLKGEECPFFELEIQGNKESFYLIRQGANGFKMAHNGQLISGKREKILQYIFSLKTESIEV